MKGNAGNSFEVDYRYDYAYDVLAIKVTRPFKYDKTVEMDEGVLLDFDEQNVPVSLEILDASKRLNVPKYSLKKLITVEEPVIEEMPENILYEVK